MMNLVRQCMTVWRLARRRLRYRASAQWTVEDSKAWAAFLHTPTGAKLDALNVNFCLDTMQDVMSKGGDAYGVGVAEGTRRTWTHLRVLSAHGDTPEDAST